MNLNFSKYTRAFAFGCSFTEYIYTTWADLIFNEMPGIEKYNFGRSGAGNLHISAKIAEANNRFKFCETDLVMVMYTTAFREDRHLNNNWVTVGNIYNQDYYNKDFVKNYVDPNGCVIRDLALIELSKSYLQNLPCDTILLKASTLEDENQSFLTRMMTSAIDLYKDTWEDFPPSLKDTVFPDGWVPNIERVHSMGKPFRDMHPLPIDYYNYLTKIGIKVSEEYAIKSQEKAYLANPNYSDWESFFPEVAQRNNLSGRILF